MGMNTQVCTAAWEVVASLNVEVLIPFYALRSASRIAGKHTDARAKIRVTVLAPWSLPVHFTS